MTHLTPHEGEVIYSPQTFSPDSQSLYYTTDRDAEFQYLVRHNLRTDAVEVIERPDWDVWYCYFSKHGKYLAVVVNNDARTDIKLYDGASTQPLQLPRLPNADITSIFFSRDETLMAFFASSSRSPRDLFVYDFTGAEPRRLTQTLHADINPDDLIDGEVVRFASYDGLEIPGILYKPHQASPQQKASALVWVHGGPGGQSRMGYFGGIQCLVNHGYVVYAINNRGSGGYGKTFSRLDDRKHGQDDLDDCVASKRMLVDTGYVDPERIGIIGGSYGGYMVLAALTFRPEEFQVGVDIFGISNWVRTLESMPVWWESFREALIDEIGDPVADRDYLESISPLFHASNIVKPLLVCQGANDPRVIKVESDEIVAAAKANGVPVEYILFDDEGHGFRKKDNDIRTFEAILEFLDRHLKGTASS
jgi:dipeptidyl aminopeptidase/acylaminoacyl peptidase